MAPTSSTASTRSFTGCGKRKRLPPNITIFTFFPADWTALSFFFVSSTSMFMFSLSNTKYSMSSPWTSPAVPENSFFPADMWPPFGMESAIMVSPGSDSAE